MAEIMWHSTTTNLKMLSAGDRQFAVRSSGCSSKHRLGVYLDSEMIMHEQVAQAASVCFTFLQVIVDMQLVPHLIAFSFLFYSSR
jgi:hypothetical protein